MNTDIPSLLIGSVVITEPMTFLTDLILAGLGFYWACRIYKSDSEIQDNPWKMKWVLALTLMSIAALLGGMTHGFSKVLSSSTLSKLWLFTLVSIGFISFFLSVGLLDLFEIKSKKIIRSFLYIKLATYLVIVFKNPVFKNAIIDYFPIIIVCLFSYFYLGIKSQSTYFKSIALGLGVSIFAAMVQLSGFTLHRHFNHNDLYHTIQIVGLFFMYKGVLAASPVDKA